MDGFFQDAIVTTFYTICDYRDYQGGHTFYGIVTTQNAYVTTVTTSNLNKLYIEGGIEGWTQTDRVNYVAKR